MFSKQLLILLRNKVIMVVVSFLQLSELCKFFKGVKPLLNARNIVGHNMLCTFDHHVEMCCDMLGVVGSSLKMVKFFIQHLQMARFMQRYCTRAYALVQFSTCNMLQHVTTWWPNTRNITMFHPTMLRHVTSRCCNCLAGALVFDIQKGS